MSLLTDEDIVEIGKIVGFDDFQSYQLARKDGVSGYQGEHWRLTIKTTQKEYGFHVKSKPKGNENVRKLFDAQRSFDKESVVYREVFRTIKKYCMFKLWPDLIWIKKNEVFVMEDLTDSGFTVCTSWDNTHFKIALKAFAAFHAASLALEHKETKLENLAPILLQESIFNESEDVSTWKGFIRACEKIIETFVPGVEIDVLSPLFRMERFVGPSTVFRNCLLHFDPWKSNILFKYLKGNPVDAIFVDFGSSRYAPPIFDVLLFLRIAEAPGIASLIGYYHNYLNNFLCALRTPAISGEEIQSSQTVYMTPAVCIAPVYTYLTRLPTQQASTILSSPEEFVRFASGNNIDLAIRALSENASYRVALVEVLCRMIRYLRGFRSE